MRLLALLLLAALASLGCSTPAAQQQADLCPAPPCAPGAASLGALCGAALDGVCSADGVCLPPCVKASDCPPPAAPTPCFATVCDGVSAACSYASLEGQTCGAGGVCMGGVCSAGAGL